MSNSRDGSVVPLDIRHNTAVSDQYAAPFIAPRRVARRRTPLGQVGLVSGRRTIDVFVVDHTNSLLVQAPYIVGVSEDGEPQIQSPPTPTPCSKTPTVPETLPGDRHRSTEWLHHHRRLDHHIRRLRLDRVGHQLRAPESYRRDRTVVDLRSA